MSVENAAASTANPPHATSGHPPDGRANRAQLLGVAALAAGILIVELGLTRLFSVLMYYHFAFLAISVALLGLSASAVFVYLTPQWHAPARLGARLQLYALLFGGLTVVSTALLLRIRLSVNVGDSLKRLGLIYLLGAAPFFAAGAGLTLAISRWHRNIDRVYGADLGGAATGCLLLIPALNYLGGPGALLVASALGGLAFLCFAPEPGSAKSGGARLAYALPLALGLLLVGGQARYHWLDVVYAKGAGARKVSFSRWNSFSRVAVYQESHGDWALSPTYRGPHPAGLVLDIDASASTPILLARQPEEVNFLRYELTAFAHHLLPAKSRVLVIGPGGGRDLWTALLFGAAEITGVELNPIIVRDVMQGRFREASGGIYLRPEVKIFVDDGRSFVRRSEEHYDLIQASLIDTWAATAAGAFALSENNLYTVEAVVDYLEHLTDNGVLTVSRWSWDGLRLASLFRAAASRLGWPGIQDRLLVVRNGKVDNYLFKKSPFTEGELGHLRRRASELGFRIVYPRASSDPPVSEGPPPADLAELVETKDLAGLLARYPLELSPTTDDRPFFFYVTRLGDLKHAFTSRAAFFNNGMALLVGLLFFSGLCAALFILVPLRLFASRQPASRLRPAELAYFACLGIGFMLVEIGLLQRFVLFLGHPVYSLTVILFTLLLGGGLGSTFSRRLGAPSRALALAIGGILMVSLLYAALLPWLFTRAIVLALPLRAAISVALLVPLGVLLGIPLPSGVSLLGQKRPDAVAWAWGVNGATSVVGATLAIAVAILGGFTVVAMAGTATYALGLLCGRRIAAG